MRRLAQHAALLIVTLLLTAGIAVYYQGPTGGTGVKPADPHEHGHDEHDRAGEGATLSDAKVAAAGIELRKAGPGVLRDSLLLNGIVQPNQEALVQVTPRFPGVVKDIRKRIGDRVAKGELLAMVESNQSLTAYELKAPIAGTVIDRQASLGEYASEQKPAFIIADLSTVWVDFSVPRRDMKRVRAGDTILIDAEDGGPEIEAKLSYVSPVGSSDTQSALARTMVGNAELRLRPGFFITGRLLLSAKPAAIAVKSSALQTLENRTVVFVRVGDKFEPRHVEVGARDSEHVEILFGLLEGDLYAAKNSFVIKAELGKGARPTSTEGPIVMINTILAFSIRQRWLVVIAVAGLAALGAWSFARLPIDAVPDITNVQVQVNSNVPGYSPPEVEQRITFPIETAMGGLPNLEYTRSLSRYGLSQVTVVFKDGTDIYFARQLVNERIQQVKDQLPTSIQTAMGPISTGLGEIYMFAVEAAPKARNPNGEPYSSTELRTILDWIVRPQLRTVPGVVEVNSIGGFEKQFHVLPNPARLMAYKLSFRDVMTALAANNANVGAGYIERNGEQYLVRTPGQVGNVVEIRNIVIGSRNGVPVRIGDVAEVAEGKELRTGAATLNGDETVLGTAMLLIGENSRTVAQRVDARLKDIQKSLPEGVVARTVYDRTALVEATIATVGKNLFEGAVLVIVILFVFLGNIRAALITACVIPLSMLFTFTGMVENKVSANLMSLGAIDFGIIIDGVVIIVENCMRRLATEQHRRGRLLSAAERHETVLAGAREVASPSLFGMLIIAIVYLPILTLTGVEGKMFTPMAVTVLMVLTGAVICSVTFVPAAIAIFVTGRVSERENILMRAARRAYLPLLDASIRQRRSMAVMAVALIVVSAIAASRMGREFIPSLDEGDAAVQALRVPGTSLSQSVEMQGALEKRLLQIPEVREVFARVGTAEVATDPMPPSIADGYVMLKPRDQWPDPRKSKAALILEIEKAAEDLPGSSYEISQPIQLRFNELISGVRSDVGVKIFGDDLDTLLPAAGQVQSVLQTVPGAADVRTEQVAGLPVLTVKLNRAALSRLGISVADVQAIVEIAVGGKEAGTVFEGDRRFELVVRLPEHLRTDVESIKALPVPLGSEGVAAPMRASVGDSPLAGMRYVPLSAVSQIEIGPGPNQISRENGKRRIVVTANVRGRDLGSFVAEAQQQIAEKVKLPAGYWITWGGQFEQLASATQRLTIVVPIALLLIFLLLFMSLGSATDAVLVFSGVPLALTGGIAALMLRDIPLSISAGVGFITLSGVAVLNGLIIVAEIQRLREGGLAIVEAAREGVLTRLRAVLMTSLVAPLGFVPMAIATGPGAEVQRPLATVVIGGIISATILTLLVLPALYVLFRREERNGEQAAPAASSPA